MANDLKGRVALIIGGTRGIGAAISGRMAQDGASVGMIHISRSQEAAHLADHLRRSGADACVVQADVSDPAALTGAMEQVHEAFGRLDILVNTAGLTIAGPLEDYSIEGFDRVFAINVRAPFLASQRAAAMMDDGGRIIMIGSIVAERLPVGGATLYAASKSALSGMTRGLARDLGSRGITVNLVQPGPIDTERNPADGPNAANSRLSLAIRRHGRADEVAGLVAYLASDAAAFVTGATYNIDGGWSA